jgi:hypothetical protein
MMMMLGALAHNVVRDVLAVSGFVEVRWSGAIRHMVLDGASAREGAR